MIRRTREGVIENERVWFMIEKCIFFLNLEIGISPTILAGKETLYCFIFRDFPFPGPCSS